MRWLLHAFFALAVFTTASSGPCTLPKDSSRSCSSHCHAPDPAGQPALHPCCSGMPDQPAQESAGGGACATHSQKCGISPTASIQFNLAKGADAQAQDPSLGSKAPEPKPWPLSITESWQDAAGLRLLAGLPCLLRESRSWAEACLPGGRALEHLARLSVFRI